MSVHAVSTGKFTDDIEDTENQKVDNASIQMDEGDSKCYRLLTKEDLIEIEKCEPIWRKIRLALFICFWILWLGLLLSAILIIVLLPKCPPRPILEFWQSSVGYWVDPFAFSDSNCDGVGDFQGLTGKLDYVKHTVGAGFLVLSSVVTGQFPDNGGYLGLNDDFNSIEPSLGDFKDFEVLIRSCHKEGLRVVLTFDFNGVSIRNSWATETSLLTPSSNRQKISRSGYPAKIELNQREYYSVMGAGNIDLNLRSPETLNRIIKVIKFWFEKGVDGILLANVAFYVENKQPDKPSTVTRDTNEWFKVYRDSQIFTDETVSFLQDLRKEVDKISLNTGRKKLLAVDPGDTGYGISLNKDFSLKFLGTSEDPGAHLIVSRDLVEKRGWKVDPIVRKSTEYSIESYNECYKNEKSSIALTSATPDYFRPKESLQTLLALVLPGTPIIYYASELGVNPKRSNKIPAEFYPKTSKPLIEQTRNENILTNRLPMPWDQLGKQFSTCDVSVEFSQYLKNFEISETVESSLASGRGENMLLLVQNLTKLRNSNPSLKWGGFDIIKYPDAITHKEYQIFGRKATGFHTFIIVVHHPTKLHNLIVDFSQICPAVTPRFLTPSNSELVLDQSVSSERIFISKTVQLIVFECV